MKMRDKMTYVCKGLQILTIAFLLFLSLQPVEVRWADADVWLVESMSVLGIVGICGLMAYRTKARITLVDAMVALWALYDLFRVYIGAEYPCATEGLKACTAILLYVFTRVVFHESRLSAWWLVAGVLLCGCYESIWGVLQIMDGTSRHHLFLLTGNFQNPGPYSAYLMMAAVVGLAVLQEKKAVISVCMVQRIAGKASNLLQSRFPDLKHAPLNSVFRQVLSHADKAILAAILLILITLPSTWSRAAFVGLGACMLWIWRNRYWRYRYFVWAGLAVCAIVLYFIKQGSADGRTVIWMSSLTSWTHSPWLGVGVGGFRHACAEGIAEMWNANPENRLFNSAGVTDYAYNDLLKILVEQGLAGAVLCVSVMTVAMIRLYRRSKPLFAGTLSLLVFSMFSYPFELMPYRVVIILIVAWSESDHEEVRQGRMLGKPQCSLGRCWAIFYTCVFIMMSLYISHETERRKEVDKDVGLFSGMHQEAFITDYYELQSDELDNAQFLFDFAKTLRESKRYQDSNAILQKGVQVSADPMFYVIMGNNYRDEKHYALAEVSYKKAFAIMPNRLYPLYQLMLMYEEMNEVKRMKEMAKRVIETNPKVESPATKEMKRKAKERI